MWTNIYLIALAIFIIPMGFFTVYSWSWLQSIGNPQTKIENFAFWSGISWAFLWISSIILLISANIILWKTRRAWALWTMLGYFVIFIILKYFWLDQLFASINNSVQNSFTLSALYGTVLCLLAAAIVFFNQFIVLRMTEKMHPTEPLPQLKIDEFSDEKK